MDKTIALKIFVMSVMSYIMILLYVSTSTPVKPTPNSQTVSCLYPSDLKKFVLDVAMGLKKARLYARGTKTQQELTNLIRKMDTFLKTQNTSFDVVVKRKSHSFKYVCPERLKSIDHDFSRYEYNFFTTNCANRQPIESFLTTTLVFSQDSLSHIEKQVREIRSLYNNMEIHIGVLSRDQSLKGKLENTLSGMKVAVSVSNPGSSIGKMWNSLIHNIKTEFVLIGRNIRYFTNDTNLYRLVREIQRIDLKAVGGSTINSENRWHIGCHQRAFRNYSLIFQEGYDESFHDCVFCDHFDGPFVIRTSDIKSVKFDEGLNSMGLFEDLFMRLGGESAICPDSVFHVHTSVKSENVANWRSFGNKLKLYQLKFSSGININFGCNHKYTCPKTTGYTSSPCCLQELNTLVNDVDRVCQKHNIFCELNCGNLVGAVKLYASLPWELDGDSRIYAGNFTAFRNLGKELIRKGYMFKSVGANNPSICTPGLHFPKRRGVQMITSPHWDLTLYSFCYSSSENSVSRGLNLTYVPNHGHYAIAPRNPALYVRNKYAFEPFAHAQHYSIVGGKDSEPIIPSHFTRCKTPGRHDCLDLYNTDGNIQFQDPIP